MCDGQTISADDYPELVTALGSNVLPNLNGRVLQGGNTAGEYKEAGLPNITAVLSGALYPTQNNGMVIVGQRTADVNNDWRGYDNPNDAVPAIAYFDASRCSTVYGASSTVQPPAYTVRYYICYG